MTHTAETLRQWYIDTCGAKEPFDMVRRDEIQVGDTVHSSHSGKRKVTAAATRGEPVGTTTLRLEGITFSPEAYPADSLIPRYRTAPSVYLVHEGNAYALNARGGLQTATTTADGAVDASSWGEINPYLLPDDVVEALDAIRAALKAVPRTVPSP